MAEDTPDRKQLDEFLASAQLQKLGLEIDELKNKNKWANRVGRSTPLITALIAVAGFFFAVNQFLVQQKKEGLAREQEQVIRDETQIRTDINQLLDLAGKTNQAIASTVFLLEDLKTLTDRRPGEKQKVTGVIIKFITDDCDFDNSRHVQIDVAAMASWDDYLEYLRRNPGVNQNILYKYFQSLRHVHDEDKPYFEKIEYQGGFGYRVPYFTEESRYTRFVGLVEGFSSHLRVDETRLEEIQSGIQKFSEALNNPTITAQLIAARILPNSRR